MIFRSGRAAKLKHRFLIAGVLLQNRNLSLQGLFKALDFVCQRITLIGASVVKQRPANLAQLYTEALSSDTLNYLHRWWIDLLGSSHLVS